ncbi:hypothetical protein [Tessaracoccus sp.]
MNHQPPHPTLQVDTCAHCNAQITRDADGFWRDQTPDPGDGHGGDAHCGTRVSGYSNDPRHEPVIKPVSNSCTACMTPDECPACRQYRDLAAAAGLNPDTATCLNHDHASLHVHNH